MLVHRPFQEKVFNSMLEDLFFPMAPKDFVMNGLRGDRIPLINLSVDKDGKEFRIEAAVAGYDSVTATVEGNEVVIKGSSSKDVVERDYALKEISSKSFERSVVIPNSVDKKNIKAMRENGMLIITMPVFESELPRVLQIEEKKA